MTYLKLSRSCHVFLHKRTNACCLLLARHDFTTVTGTAAAKKEDSSIARRRPRRVPKSIIQSYELFASTLPGLEKILHHELVAIGMQVTKNTNENDQKGGRHFRVSTLTDMYKCHLHLGTASHIFLRAGAPFHATGMEELVRKVGQMQFWKSYVQLDFVPDTKKGSQRERKIDMTKFPTFDIRVTSSKSRLYHTKGIAERVERGIAIALGVTDDDRLNEAFEQSFMGAIESEEGANSKQKEDENSNTPKIKVMVRVYKNEVEISVDTSATPLHRRGYRMAPGKAPLREDLAYGLLYSLNWGKQDVIENESKNQEAENSVKDPNKTFPTTLVDPFCGSGTILIEGACMKLGLAPGRLRQAPFEHSRLHDPSRWEHLIKSSLPVVDSEDTESTETANDTIPKIKRLSSPSSADSGDANSQKCVILGSDRDAGVIQSAKENIERAGLGAYMSDNIGKNVSSSTPSHMGLEIDLHSCAISSNPFFQNPSSLPNVLVATNPPYGIRISPKKDVDHVYDNPLLPLYQTLGKVNAKECNGPLNYGVVAHDISLARRLGVKGMNALFTTRNGGLSICALGTNNIIK